jgi:gas vesicle protein
LVVGAVALALGVAVGAAVPSTRYEGKLMGDAKESLVSKAQTAARDALDRVQDVVGQAKEAIIEDAKQVVNQAKDTLTGESEAEDSGQRASANSASQKQ